MRVFALRALDQLGWMNERLVEAEFYRLYSATYASANEGYENRHSAVFAHRSDGSLECTARPKLALGDLWFASL